MTGFTVATAGNMAKGLARCDRAIVATAAVAHHSHMIDACHLTPAGCGMAIFASIHYRHVICGFDRRGNTATAGMAEGATCRRAFESCA